MEIDYKKVAEILADKLAERTGSCPLDSEWIEREGDCNKCEDTYAECFLKWAEKQSKKE